MERETPDRRNINNAHPYFRRILDIDVRDSVWTDLDIDIFNVDQQTVDRLIETRQNDRINFYTAEASRLELFEATSIDAKTGVGNDRLYRNDLREQVGRNTTEHGLKPLHVVRVDMGMLNLVNAQEGHQRGDDYKIAFARYLDPFLIRDQQNPYEEHIRYIYGHFDFFRVYIVGGDEFAIIFRGNEEDVRQYMDMLQHSMELSPELPEIRITDPQGDFVIPPENFMDYGLCSLHNTIVEDYYRSVRPGTDVNDTVLIGKTIDYIADRKADMQKAFKRIHLLIDLYNNRRWIYDRMKTYSLKGALEISTDALERYNRLDNATELILEFIQSVMQFREINAQNRIDDEFQRALHAYVAENMENLMSDIVY